MTRAFAVAFLLTASNAFAAEKTDLSAFFSPGGTIGDFAVWRSDGDATRMDELIDIGAVKKSIVYVTQSTEDGFVVLSESGVIPGKWLLQGSALADDLEVYFPKLVKSMPLKMVLGKTYKYGGSARVYYQGQKVGKAKLKGTIRFVGFAPIVTPFFTGNDAAHFVETSTLTIKFKGLGELRNEGTSEWATDRLLGTLESIESSRTFEDGLLVEEEGPVTWWFESGEFGGVAVP